jgi:hypothetical protein
MFGRATLRALSIAFGVLCTFLPPTGLWAQGPGSDAFEHVRRIQERHTDRFLVQPGVVGTAVGFDEHGGQAFLILLEEPNVPDIPNQLEGVQVRPVVTGKIYALSSQGFWLSLLKPSATGTPAAPTNLAAAAAANGTDVTLTWTDNSSNEQGFRIECKSTGAYSQIASVGPNVKTYTNKGLNPSTAYTYRIRAYNFFGNSSYSNEASTTTPVAPLPALWCVRPVPIGVSTGHSNITAGTISCRVVKGTAVYALSNNHVYANENRASLGDNVLQPGKYDGGMNPRDSIGTLSAYSKIAFSRQASNTIDAAIALCTPATLGNSTPAAGYGIPGASPATAQVGMAVKKYGRTTGLTHGRISAVNATVNVSYDSGTARFVNQIVITSSAGSFSDGGDSGSLIVTDTDNNSPVGLLFAGSTTTTIANPIGPVLDYFGVTIDGK